MEGGTPPVYWSIVICLSPKVKKNNLSETAQGITLTPPNNPGKSIQSGFFWVIFFGCRVVSCVSFGSWNPHDGETPASQIHITKARRWALCTLTTRLEGPVGFGDQQPAIEEEPTPPVKTKKKKHVTVDCWKMTAGWVLRIFCPKVLEPMWQCLCVWMITWKKSSCNPGGKFPSRRGRWRFQCSTWLWTFIAVFWGEKKFVKNPHWTGLFVEPKKKVALRLYIFVRNSKIFLWFWCPIYAQIHLRDGIFWKSISHKETIASNHCLPTSFKLCDLHRVFPQGVFEGLERRRLIFGSHRPTQDEQMNELFDDV